MTISVPFYFREALDDYAKNNIGRPMSEIIVESVEQKHPKILDYKTKSVRRVIRP